MAGTLSESHQRGRNIPTQSHRSAAGIAKGSGMSNEFRLMCLLAHPDDESLAMGGALIKYATEGVETYLVTATRGERGWLGKPEDYPGPEELGKTREAELHCAAHELGIKEVSFLDYLDGELDQVDPAQAISRIVAHIRRVRPHVVVTFDPNGLSGHPDHIAICQFTTAAVVAAADPTFLGSVEKPHRVSKLYYRIESERNISAYESTFGRLVLPINGEERRPPGWEDWAITTRVDTTASWPQVWKAVACHKSQSRVYTGLNRLPYEIHQNVWASQAYYRAFSLVNGGRGTEKDLFAGLR